MAHNMVTVKVSKSQVAGILAATFPKYRGRKFKVAFQECLTFWDTNWSGGTRNSYAAVRADGEISHLAVPAPWVNPVEGMTVEIPVDVLVVKHSIFCGKDCGITIYAHPTHLPKWLPAPISSTPALAEAAIVTDSSVPRW